MLDEEGRDVGGLHAGQPADFDVVQQEGRHCRSAGDEVGLFFLLSAVVACLFGGGEDVRDAEEAGEFGPFLPGVAGHVADDIEDGEGAVHGHSRYSQCVVPQTGRIFTARQHRLCTIRETP